MKNYIKTYLFTVLDMWHLNLLQIYSLNPLYLVFTYVNGYFEEINGNKYLTPFSTNKRKEKNKKL